MPLPKWFHQLLAEIGLIRPWHADQPPEVPISRPPPPPPAPAKVSAAQAAPIATSPVSRPTVAPAQQKPPQPTAPQKPQPRIVTTDTVMRVPWLRPFDQRMESVGFDPIHVNVAAPAGSNIYVDEANRRARITYPDGRVKAWSGFTRLEVRPASSWHVEWMKLEEEEPSVMFLKDDDSDDEIVRQTGYSFHSKGVEGQEKQLWPEFVKLVKDPLMNPHGFPLKSGLYVHFFVSFNLNFGEDGTEPSIIPVAETLPPTLDFPHRTEITILRPITVGSKSIPAGQYETEVMGFNTETGEASHIECKNLRLATFYIGSLEMAQLMHEGKVDLLKVVQDRMPNF